MSTAFLLVHSRKTARLLLTEEAPPAGRLGLISMKGASDAAQVAASFGAALNLKTEQLPCIVNIGHCAGPDWGHAASPATTYTFYGLEMNDSLEASLQQLPIKYHWIEPPVALSRWHNAETHLAPPTAHFLELVSRCGSVETLRAAVQSEGLHLRWCFAPRLELLPLPSPTIPPFTRTNTVFLRSKHDLLIVDPGAASSHHSELEAAIRARAHGVHNVTVVLTHHHHDHIHGLPCVERAAPNALVVCHPHTLSRVRTSLRTRPASTEILHIGDVALSLLFTPGHTDGHLVLFEPRTRTLLAGDHVVGVGSAVLDPECGDMAQYLQSTRLLVDLRPQLIYPAHGPPCLDGVAVLNTYILHREQREASILASYKRGNTLPEQIVKDVYTDVPVAMHAFALRNVELHLRKLRQESKL